MQRDFIVFGCNFDVCGLREVTTVLGMIQSSRRVKSNTLVGATTDFEILREIGQMPGSPVTTLTVEYYLQTPQTAQPGDFEHPSGTQGTCGDTITVHVDRKGR